MVTANKRNNALDFMKFIAVIMITNSHFQPLYKDVNVGLATFGVHGNALFFFVAGFLLMAGFKKKSLSFANWFKKRMHRLWPAVFLWVSLTSIFFDEELICQRFLFFSDYCFLQCIVVYYALFFLFCSKQRFTGIGGTTGVYWCSIIIAVLLAIIQPKCEGSIFHTDWHYVCHFSAMVLGAICFERTDKHKKQKKDWFICLLSFIAYFIILGIGKDRDDALYYVQILGLLPLHVFLWYFYKICNREWTKKLFSVRCLGDVVKIISALTLEIYIVQFHIITDRLNSLFPLSIIAIFIAICLMAYLLRLMVDIFVQFMSNDEWDIKKIGKLF